MPIDRFRMFEMWRSGDTNLAVDLPTAWAKQCTVVGVAFTETNGLGLHASLMGDGERILSFPWHDHVNDLLRDEPARFPIDPLVAWDDLDQGWWGSVAPADGFAYIAQTDLDICSITATDAIQVSPGHVQVGGVDISWHAVAADEYRRAWLTALASLRQRR